MPLIDLYDELLFCLQSREDILLATIIAASGSTPLPAGARILVGARAERTSGTVGGGLFEATVIAEGREFLLRGQGSLIRRYDLDQDATGGGMICGGSAEVLFEILTPADEGLFRRLHTRHSAGEASSVLRFLDSSKNVTGRAVVGAQGSDATPDENIDGLLGQIGMTADRLLEHLQLAEHTQTVTRAAAPRGEIVIEPVPGIQQLLVFGGGHVARCVSSVAATAGFAVTVVDDRAEFATRARFPNARQALAIPFQEAFLRIAIGPSTSIVIMTRGHLMDRQILELAVRTPARYIGMIGSAKKVASTFAGLRESGTPVELLKRVHAPIGLDIGAVTAEEIAVSIVAELIRSRRAVDTPPAPLSWKMKSWFDDGEMRGRKR